MPLHEWHELEVGPGAGSVQDLATWLFDENNFAPAAKLTSKGAYSVVCDHLGTPLSMYDGQGKATWEMSLDSYGGVRQGRGRPQDCPFRYQGQYEDVETGLYYNRFRYYDPEAGSYISQDPLRLESGQLNFYGYVADPGSAIDPLGLVKFCKLFDKKLGITQRWVDRLTGKSASEVEADLVRKGWAKSYPQAAQPSAIQHTQFSRTTKAGDKYILDYHPGSTPTQANLHGTPYWKVYKEVNGEKQVLGRIAPEGFENYGQITDSPVFVNGARVN